MQFLISEVVLFCETTNLVAWDFSARAFFLCVVSPVVVGRRRHCLRNLELLPSLRSRAVSKYVRQYRVRIDLCKSITFWLFMCMRIDISLSPDIYPKHPCQPQVCANSIHVFQCTDLILYIRINSGLKHPSTTPPPVLDLCCFSSPRSVFV